jgi:hypothetical protein
MPRFVVERTMEGVTKEQFQEVGRRSTDVLEDLSGVRWIRSYVSEADGKVYCEYDAPSEEVIREASRLAGLPVDRISEISIELRPDMFR